MSDDRLVPSPVFVLSTIRSGSTLLRCLLGSHPDVHAPHELHLGGLTVAVDDEFTDLSVRTLGLSQQDLEHLLWDRLLHRQLTQAGKSVLVEKSPGNVFIWRRIVNCWPSARYIILRRHPVAIADSIRRAGDAADLAEAAITVDKFASALDEAAADVPTSISVTYEQLTADPEATCKALCEHLGIPWEPTMLDYGRHDHGPFVYGIGDWSPQIASGQIQAATPPPPNVEIPPLLRSWCEKWGYTA
ncbi:MULTISPECIES: sulfotransferase [unclassified Kitasatospora]|uniref:sulfotransferase family protein n=1 Tax=unclassified Kitasatospora TaxID=2633591 RepID=UPI00070DFC95|nr:MULTISPECIES: sulfotransferase [unclassified Kitasatospora]KQV20858.1 sulfotransferase [Kitasatospora sp. Root107]KRB60487.1 sulfotransferase [Kitasatospora sp. Root187]